MALVKPIALNVNAFDAKNEQTFYFTVSSGTQVTKNRLTIRDNFTNKVVYQNTLETFQFNQTVPSNTLKNNTYYNYYFNTLDSKNNVSEDSNIVQFYCYNTPTLTFDNLINGQEIEASNYEFSLTYGSKDSELLNYIEFILYDSNNEEIDRSEKYYGSSTIPQNFKYKYSGFDNSSYSIIAKGITVNGTEISSKNITFTVRYYYPTIYSLLDLEQKCNDGYVKILSNVVMPDNEHKPDELRYIEISNKLSKNQDNQFMLDIYDYGEFVKWYNGFKIPSNFKIGIWGKPSKLGIISYFYDEDNKNNKFTISLNRVIPYGGATQKDFYELHGYKDGELFVYQRSNYVEIMNNNSYYFLTVKKIGSKYELLLEVFERTIQIMEWGNSNAEYGKITSDVYWKGEENKKETSLPKYLNNDIESIFMLDRFEVRNGLFDNLNITKNTKNKYPKDSFPKWDYDTIINCDFNKNLIAGNIGMMMSQLSYVKIKRRKKGTFNWVTLYKIPIKTEEDLNIVLKDNLIQSGAEYDYAFVPVMPDGTEGGYVTNKIKAILNGTFISDQDKTFKLYSGTVLTTVKNQSVGVLQPINSKYPLLIKNGRTDFVSGTVGGTILGYNFEKTKIIDRNDVVKQAEDLEDFLTDGNAKILSDQNGNCWLVRFNGMPSKNYNQIYGNGIITISDNWVEQGNPNSQIDLYDNDILKDIE